MNETTLIGKLVRAEWRGQWFTARITDSHDGDVWSGVVVDPGNYIFSVRGYMRDLNEGEHLTDIVGRFLTVIEECSDD